jgi:hypothetical protein
MTPQRRHAGEIAAWKVGMHDAEVDPEERHPDLGVNFPPAPLQRAHHRILKGRFRFATRRRDFGDGARAVLGEFQEVLEVDHAFGAGAPEVDLPRTERREHQKLATRTGDRDVGLRKSCLCAEVLRF